MGQITSNEWYDWKRNPITQAFMEAAIDRIEEAKEVLSQSAGMDSNYDRQLVGLIQAYREMQDFRVEGLQDGD